MAATIKSIVPWTANKIPFVLPSDHPGRQQILDAMNQIESQSVIWFCKRGNEPNYIEITNDSSKGNFSETIGMCRGKAIVNIREDTWWGLHELCHVVGLIHEQSRSDSQQSIETYFRTDSNPNGVVDPNNRNMSIDADSENSTSFDRVSVMQYAKDMGLISGTNPPSMIWRADSKLPLGADNRRALSALDLDGIRCVCAKNTTGWAPQSHIDGVATRTAPALAAFNNRLYAAWNGYHNDGIFFSSFDGSAWQPQSKIEGVATKTGIALAEFQGRLYAAWNGYHNDGIYYAYFDGATWSSQGKIEGVSTQCNPALAVYKNRLYAAWNGYHNDGIFFSSFDGSAWLPQSKIEGVATKHSPSLTCFGDFLYAVWNGYHNDGLFYANYNGASWNAQSRVSDYGASLAPAVSSFYDPYDPTKPALYLAWAGSGGGFWWANSNNIVSNWSGQMRLQFGTNAAPAMAPFLNKLYMLWYGSGNDGLYYSSFVPDHHAARLLASREEPKQPVCMI